MTQSKAKTIVSLFIFTPVFLLYAAPIRLPGRAVATRSANIISVKQGIVVDQCVANGSMVDEGQVLFRLDSQGEVLNISRAEAKLTLSKTQYEIAKKAYDRRVAVEHGVSKEAVEIAQGSMDAAKAQLHEAEVALQIARAGLRACEIRAPFAGMVGSATKGPGDFVSTSSGPMINLTAISPIRVKFSLSNANFLRLFNANPTEAARLARVRLILSDGRAFDEEGVIEYMENVVDEDTDSVRMYATFKNENMIIRPGSSVTVELRTDNTDVE